MWRLDPGWNDSDHGSALLRCAGHNVRKPRHAYDFIIDLLPIGLNTLLAVISNYTRLKYFILMGWGEEPKTACIKNTVVIIFKLRGRWWGRFALCFPHLCSPLQRNVFLFCFNKRQGIEVWAGSNDLDSSDVQIFQVTVSNVFTIIIRLQKLSWNIPNR